jgi:hypothetical protein
MILGSAIPTVPARRQRQRALACGLGLFICGAIGDPRAAVADSPEAPVAADSVSAYFDQWFARVDAAQASQPHWMTPLATVTPRLEQEFRYDEFWQHQGSGATLNNIDGGKGLELIPTETNEILINLPSYEERNVKSPVSGWGDWAFLTVKQRLLSANEENGNYIVTAFLGLQAPTGDAAFTNDAWVVTPTIAAGKGWGDFDIQATAGAQLPLSHESTIGTAIVTNATAQYHLGEHFWPELELNDTYWSGGERDGKSQLFLTPGIMLGRFPLGGRAKASIGVGYQIALSPSLTIKPLTPAFDHAWIVSARLGF